MARAAAAAEEEHVNANAEQERAEEEDLAAAAAGALRLAAAEGLELIRSERSASGFRGVTRHGGIGGQRFHARMKLGGTDSYLGSFRTAEEAIA